MWIKDPKTQEKSVTLTMMVIAFLIAMAKWTFGGMEMFGFNIPAFDPTAATVMVGFTSGLYGGRKYTDAKK